jgi:hypothetical protein
VKVLTPGLKVRFGLSRPGGAAVRTGTVVAIYPLRVGVATAAGLFWVRKADILGRA